MPSLSGSLSGRNNEMQRRRKHASTENHDVLLKRISTQVTKHIHPKRIDNYTFNHNISLCRSGEIFAAHNKHKYSLLYSFTFNHLKTITESNLIFFALHPPSLKRIDLASLLVVDLSIAHRLARLCVSRLIAANSIANIIRRVGGAGGRGLLVAVVRGDVDGMLVHHRLVVRMRLDNAVGWLVAVVDRLVVVVAMAGAVDVIHVRHLGVRKETTRNDNCNK
jgi:hypothetical protein